MSVGIKYTSIQNVYRGSHDIKLLKNVRFPFDYFPLIHLLIGTDITFKKTCAFEDENIIYLFICLTSYFVIVVYLKQ